MTTSLEEWKMRASAQRILGSQDLDVIMSHIRNGTIEQYKQEILTKKRQEYINSKTGENEKRDKLKNSIQNFQYEINGHEKEIVLLDQQKENIEAIKPILDELLDQVMTKKEKERHEKFGFPEGIMNDVASFVEGNQTTEEFTKKIMSRSGFFDKTKYKTKLENFLTFAKNNGLVNGEQAYQEAFSSLFYKDDKEKATRKIDQAKQSFQYKIKEAEKLMERDQTALQRIEEDYFKEFEKMIGDEHKDIDNFDKVLKDIKALESEPIKGKFDEPVTFNLKFDGLNMQKPNVAFENAFRIMGQKMSDENEEVDTSKWFLNYMKGDYPEVWSPFVEANNTDIIKFIKSMELLGFENKSPLSPITQNNILIEVPPTIKQNDVLLDIPDKQAIQERAKQILGVDSNGQVDLSSLQQEIITKGSVILSTANAYNSVSEDKTVGGKFKEEPGETKYIFSGTMVSNDRFSLSNLCGRSGILYGTPRIGEAACYAGILKDGMSATQQKYIETSGMGFINVYKATENNRYYGDLGIENNSIGVSSPSQIQGPACETQVLNENEFISKLAVVRIDGIIYALEYDRSDPRWQIFEELRQADLTITWNKDSALFKRNRAQYQEMKTHGRVNTHNVICPQQHQNESKIFEHGRPDL